MNRLPTRLQEKIIPEPNSGCWLWLGFIRPDGYGMVYHEGKSRYAHRVIFILLKGPISTATLDHTCRLRCCVNPEHLEPVSFRENVLRGIGPTAHNYKKDRCVRGHLFDAQNTIIHENGTRNCLQCRVEYSTKWQHTNKDKRAIYRRRYYEKSGR